MIANIVFQVIGGLGLFLYGMENMSGGMRKLAGSKLKKILAAFTTNPLMGILVGIFITVLVQSSSVSTVMTVGFVNASLLTMKQALGIILGANIGTTVTGWILILSIGAYGLPIIGVSVIVFMAAKSERLKNAALTLMGFGFIFFGLQTMSNGMKPLRELPGFVNLFYLFKADSYFGVVKAALVGAVLTGIVQSSAATLGITIMFANQGLIDFPTGAALVLGENIGTTVTALLASLNTNSNARRVALAHTIFNTFGTVWVTAIFPFYLKIIGRIADPAVSVERAIVMSHSLFNVFNVLLFAPFLGPYAAFLEKIIKGKSEAPVRVTKLNQLMLQVPSVVVSQTKLEIIEMGEKIQRVFIALDDVFHRKDNAEESLKLIADTERMLDLYEKEISDINFTMLNQELSSSMIRETRGNLITTDEFETISDYLDRIAKEVNKLRDDDLKLSEGNRNVLFTINGMVSGFFNEVFKAYDRKDVQLFVNAIREYDEMKFVYREAKIEHFSADHGDIPSRLSVGYIDMLNYYRRACDHIYNIIEHFAQI
ncbi:MAG: Na/Pi cotransporter family protein [Fusobacteriaceae bacterium]|nr:Na/Pi cotransporter family protein [Fusobacteriaceae bacterium]